MQWALISIYSPLVQPQTAQAQRASSKRLRLTLTRPPQLSRSQNAPPKMAERSAMLSMPNSSRPPAEG